MTGQQKKFCREYLADGNAKAAAIRAGYSPKNYSIAKKLMSKAEIRRYIKDLKQEAANDKTAATQEVVGFLTAVMRGEIDELKSSAKDRLHAAELLGKRYGIFDDKDGGDRATVVFSGEGELLE